MNFIFLSLFPEQMSAFFSKGIISRAVANGLLSLEFLDLRQFSDDRWGRVDDKPFGGGDGMLLRADIIYRAVCSINQYQCYQLLYPSPKGRRISQSLVDAYATDSSKKGFIFLPGYYEGVDERVLELLPVEKVSLGDYVLSSSDLPGMVVADAVIRLLPGVMGEPECAKNDSHSSGLLEYPQYTKPRNVEELLVPSVLTSGSHKQIRLWNQKKSIANTLFLRPDLLARVEMSGEALGCLGEVIEEVLI